MKACVPVVKQGRYKIKQWSILWKPFWFICNKEQICCGANIILQENKQNTFVQALIKQHFYLWASITDEKLYSFSRSQNEMNGVAFRKQNRANYLEPSSHKEQMSDKHMSGLYHFRLLSEGWHDWVLWVQNTALHCTAWQREPGNP